VNRRIGVAGGRGKVEAIRAALKGGWINGLITDRGTAGRLVSDKSG
jgi:DNA-binding transcriptional regulator LsrR (DeoR family)